MNWIIIWLVFFLALFIHELTHILISWYFSKNIPKIRLGLNIKITPKTIFSYRQKSLFLGVPIISGMFTVFLFYFFFPNEMTTVMIAYLISCGRDFYNLILLEVKNKKWKQKD